MADDAAVAELDEIEVHPDFYVRKQIKVNPAPNNGDIDKQTVTSCWTYLLYDFKETLLQSEFFDRY